MYSNFDLSISASFDLLSLTLRKHSFGKLLNSNMSEACNRIFKEIELVDS